MTLDDAATPPDTEWWVTALVAKVTYIAAENQCQRTHKHPGRCCPRNSIIKVLLDSSSDGDLWFHEKGTHALSHLTRQVPLSWNVSNGSFLAKGRSKVTLKIFEYSKSREYIMTPDVVEYEKGKMA